MWILDSALMIMCLFFCASATQYRYVLLQENMTMENLNEDALNFKVGVYKVNDTTNALNFTATLKVDLPEDSKVYVSAMKWVSGDYRLGFIQFTKTIHSAVEMEMFDLQGVFVDNCHPPMIWPLQKGVRYHSIGWSPDSTKFPPNLPEGRWKVRIAIAFGNKTKIVDLDWYLKAVYKK